MHIAMAMNSSLYIKSCRLSYAAYNTHHKHKPNPKYNFKYYHTSKDVPPQALLCVEKNYTYLVFRGSKNIRDLFLATDSNYSYLHGCSHNDNNIRCHSGYLKRYQDLHNNIICDLHDYTKISDPSNNTNLIITGHSMGGALAKIACLYIASAFMHSKQNPTKNIYVYTFGAPKIANKEFYEEVAHKANDYAAFELDNDIIPKLVLGTSSNPKNPYVIQLESNTNMHNILKNHSCFSYITALKKMNKQ